MKNSKIKIFGFISSAILCNTLFAQGTSQHISLISKILTYKAKKNYAWQCDKLSEKPLTKSNSVKWVQVICHGQLPGYLNSKKPTGNLKINLIDANLADNKITLTPVLAKTVSPNNPYRQNLQQMGADNKSLLAGINGGYFFVNLSGKHYRDINCLEKSARHYDSTQGIGDGLLIINKTLYSTNCNSRYLSEPARSSLLEDINNQWQIKEIPGHVKPTGIINAIGAGPGLIQTINGKPQIAVTWEGISSSFEFSANTSLILAKDKFNKMHVIFMTVDGRDKVTGMSSTEMANFIYYMLPKLLNINLISAMNMDQGGSTTMYVRDASPQIVSKSHRVGVNRTVFDALFIAEK